MSFINAERRMRIQTGKPPFSVSMPARQQPFQQYIDACRKAEPQGSHRVAAHPHMNIVQSVIPSSG